MTQPTPGTKENLPARPDAFTSDDYAGITSFDDAMRLVESKLGGEVIDAGDLGDGFAVIDNKSKGQLVGVPFVILSTRFADGDYRDEAGNVTEFVSCRLVTKDGRKLVLNDGGSGICDQIRTLYKHKPHVAGTPIMVWNGLRESTYDHPQHGRSTTHYLDTSPAK